MRFLLALITLFGLDSAYLRNQEGVRLFQQKAAYGAYQSFLKALELDPLNPALNLNLARIFEENQEYEKAEQGYASVLKMLPDKSEARFQTLFNLAGVEAKQSKIDSALTHYQAALDIMPDSKEVKTNIELLWQGGQGQGQNQNQDKKDDKKDQQKNGEGQQKDQTQRGPTRRTQEAAEAISKPRALAGRREENFR